MIQMRQNALPIIEAAGVDLVLCGHSHVYERSFLLYGHYGYSSTFSEANKIDGGDGHEPGDGAYRQVDGKGTVYVVAGVGGHPLGFYYGSHPAHRVNIGSAAGFCIIDVSGERLDFKFIDTWGDVLDNFTLRKGTNGPPRLLAYLLTTNYVTLTWETIPGQRYQVVQARVLAGPWVPASGPIIAGSLLASWSSNLPRGVPQNFYRIARLPEPNNRAR
jgi:hypothetical protein